MICKRNTQVWSSMKSPPTDELKIFISLIPTIISIEFTATSVICFKLMSNTFEIFFLSQLSENVFFKFQITTSAAMTVN